MAIMWPRQVPKDIARQPERSSEVKVFKRLQRELEDDWHVYYSRPWRGMTPDGFERDGECDFVLAAPDFGLVFIEVKGGRVSHNPETGQWSTVDRNDIRYRIKDPFLQARSSKHEIVNKLRESHLWPPGVDYIGASYGVIFTDADWKGGDMAMHAPLAKICDKSVFESGLRSWIQKLGREEKNADTANKQVINALHWLIASPVEMQNLAARVVKEESDQIELLTNEQYQTVYEGLQGAYKRLLFTGGAGSGKTIAAMKIASGIVEQGGRCLLVCFNGLLADRMRYQLCTREGLTVSTFHSICTGLVRAQSGSVLSEDDFESLVDKAFDAVAGTCTNLFDAIVVDEAQDFRPHWFDILEALLDPDGPRLLRVFMDSNQKAYPEVVDHQHMIERGLQLFAFPLTENLRNTKSIFRSFGRFYEGRRHVHRGPTGEAVRNITLKKGEDPALKIVSEIGFCIDRLGLTPESVVVLGETGPHAVILRNAVLACTDSDELYKAVVFESVRRFKGLESEAAVLVVQHSASWTDELLYVGHSRPRLHLSVIWSLEAKKVFSD